MTDLRKLMLEELERRNYSQATMRAYLRAVGGVRAILQPPSGPTRPRSHPPVPGVSVPREETDGQQRHAAARRTAVLLYQDAEAILERGTDAVPEEGAAAAVHSQPGGSNQPHRIRPHAVPAHSADGALCHRPPSRRTGQPEDHRHRQSAQRDPRAGWKRPQGPRCHAQPEPARSPARALARTAAQTRPSGCFPATLAHRRSSDRHQGHLGWPAKKRPSAPASARKFIRTLCGTVSPLTCSKPARIYGPSRFCWAIAIWKRPPSISTSRSTT